MWFLCVDFFLNGDFEHEFVLNKKNHTVDAVIPRAVAHGLDADIHSCLASVQILLYPGCCCLFFFPFVLLIAVKPEFKGD